MQISIGTSIKQNDKIKIFIVDDHPLLLEGMQLIINKQTDYHVCGSASSIQETLQTIVSCHPDILVADMQIKDENGIELIHEVKKVLPHIKILMISMHNQPYYIEKSFQAGANGYIVKSESSDYLVKAIQMVYSGKIYMSPEVESKLLNQVMEHNTQYSSSLNVDQLTARERELFELIGKGKNTKEIANRLNISPRTVDAHKENIKKKLNQCSMKDVLELAIEWSKINVK